MNGQPDPPVRLSELAPGLFCLASGAQNGFLLDLGAETGAEGPTWVWIDPGPAEKTAALLEKARPLLGEHLENLGLLVVSHLDSAALGAVPELCRRAPRARVMMTQETWNFAALTGIPEVRVAIAERYRQGFRLSGDTRPLEVVLTPYAQYTAAFLLYDPHSATLFSADLLAGGRGADDHGELWARACDWPRVAAFQMHHMPCAAALRWSLERIDALPRLDRVCPHHGGLLQAEVLTSFLSHLRSLRVGADLLPGAEVEFFSRENAVPPSCPPLI